MIGRAFYPVTVREPDDNSYLVAACLASVDVWNEGSIWPQDFAVLWELVEPHQSARSQHTSAADETRVIVARRLVRLPVLVVGLLLQRIRQDRALVRVDAQAPLALRVQDHGANRVDPILDHRVCWVTTN